MRPIKNFISSAAAFLPGSLLCIVTALALIIANTDLNSLYQDIFNSPFIAGKSFQWIINDCFMVIFFLVIGLEIKREIVTGHLSNIKSATLPLIAATGGAIVPAIIFCTMNWGDADAIKGWAVPTATDIAFALEVMMMLRARISNSLKVCLVTIAVIDDLFAVAIIALFYTYDISLLALLLAFIGIGVAAFMNYRNVTALTPYLIVGVFIWVCVLQSGIHPTIAGVALGLLIPIKLKNKQDKAPATKLEHLLHPYVSFLILPLFAFANAGISLAGLSVGDFAHPITLGIMLGLFFGKQSGIMLATYIACRLKVAKLPTNSTWRQYYGMALLTGIGFTMSLFIGNLAFPDAEQINEVKLGVLSGSLLSAVAGILVLLTTTQKQKASD